MTDHRDWTGKVGSIWAQEWRRTDRSFTQLTPRLLAAIEANPFEHVLDIGCGAGEIACGLAQRHSNAKVLGVDIAPELLEVARQRAEGLANCDFVHGDAARFAIDRADAPDLLVSRHGVMFFPDPAGAFGHLLSQAQPAASLVFSCFRTREENEWVSATLEALLVKPEAPDLREPGPFAFGERDYVEGILKQAGWQDIAFESLDLDMIFGGGDDPVADATDYLSRVGPTATPIAELEGAERDETLARLSRILEQRMVDGTVRLPAAIWIVTARAPD